MCNIMAASIWEMKAVKEAGGHHLPKPQRPQMNVQHRGCEHLGIKAVM